MHRATFATFPVVIVRPWPVAAREHGGERRSGASGFIRGGVHPCSSVRPRPVKRGTLMTSKAAPAAPRRALNAGRPASVHLPAAGTGAAAWLWLSVATVALAAVGSAVALVATGRIYGGETIPVSYTHLRAHETPEHL